MKLFYDIQDNALFILSGLIMYAFLMSISLFCEGGRCNEVALLASLLTVGAVSRLEKLYIRKAIYALAILLPVTAYIIILCYGR